MRKPLLIYILLVFVLTYSIEGLVYLLGGLQAFSIIASLAMLLPAISAIIVWVIYYRDNKFWKFFGLRLGKIKYWFIYPMLMLVTLIIIYLISYIIYPNQFLNSSELQHRMKDTFIFIPGVPALISLLIPLALNLTVGIIFSIIAYLGEELGWRAFMYPQLTKLGLTKGLIIGGIIWGLWHLPLILMGHNYPNHPILGNIMMILMCMPLGIILYYSYIKSGSIFVPAIMHGIFNQFSSTLTIFSIKESQFDPLIYGSTGIIGIIILSIIAIFCIKRMKVFGKKYSY
ncbi:CPBP family intramembrane metalloprotease [Staphylococcus sp. NRL 16/872]|uniref:CPBP family intramembrane glutamic endopeptidase n=1 Tax=Staphylococcus sp. NRL 16/872 TaxID=2930131 RepID=UPI001FB1EA50|nr:MULTISPECIES: CPBP family intramembrane glutamic endopeptidase [unclassified Staphylococcus]MCJ1655339.1 CPBP family intramembrane metalloprotease [Staphylococcus sp. NRL 21/187]MCJ1661176.1 CPBP family intramembrane metalloprotease [Staphylococcus sp. NRL 18/288]MCJ1667067.1 CPBP family intramembrane metalloprotease [Staphylococcus sp. NRL 19/737]WEN69542.1 CPBP family intramembrane metalloprotease [Staphylococcus sp. NRL 16/872]